MNHEMYVFSFEFLTCAPKPAGFWRPGVVETVEGMTYTYEGLAIPDESIPSLGGVFGRRLVGRRTELEWSDCWFLWFEWYFVRRFDLGSLDIN